MKLYLRFLGVIFALLPGLNVLAAETVVHHELRVTLSPESGNLKVRDIITLPPNQGSLSFSLHQGLSPTTPDANVHISPDPKTSNDSDMQRYRVSVPTGLVALTLDYQGKIREPLKQIGSGSMRNLQITLGFIREDGVYLDGNSGWYPRFDDELVSFAMDVTLPSGWKAVSQGPYPERTNNVSTWKEVHPQEQIFLLAAPYHEYTLAAGAINSMVYLRTPDSTLASQYLTTSEDYVKMYTRLLGLYPYGKFAVVENSWESGYGMPSFTLLGPRVMRLPFILRTSLPHEILHNWWGNGVYVDYSEGNWSEGLTAYLADHLIREQSGQGAEYRRNSLLRYANYVSKHNDFPLKEFHGRHSEATQAVGYDKGLMVFHMLRLELGDADFLTALRNFYNVQRFHRASWDDLRSAFEKVTHHSLLNEFRQWLDRTGAPSLQVSDARTEPNGKGYVLSAVINQTQSGDAYKLHIPIAVQLAGQEQAWQGTIDMAQKKQTLRILVPARPWRLVVDPQFDVFRRLDPGELPATLSEALGAEKLLFVLPSAAPASIRDGYERLAQAWADGDSNMEIRWDKDLKQLPMDRAVWLMGWENHFAKQVSTAIGVQAMLSEDAATVGGKSLSKDKDAVVLTARNGKAGKALVWLGCDNPAALPGLSRKLPHYGSYSYLAFEGDAPTNDLKGQWQVLDSPMNIAVRQVDNKTAPPNKPLVLAPREPLIKASFK